MTALGAGAPRIPTLAMWLQVVLLLVIMSPLLFISQWAIVAVFAGYLFSMLIATVYLFVKTHRLIELPPRVLLSRARMLGFLGYSVLVLGTAFLCYFLSDSLSRSIFVVCLVILAYTMACYALSWVLPLFPSDDKDTMRVILRRAYCRIAAGAQNKASP